MSLAERLQQDNTAPADVDGDDLRMSLAGHLDELRSRLLRCVVAVLVLAVASLVFARPIFGVLMQPVLNALPEGSRTLVYTSGIEELNVLMKVGLYAGIFLTTPVILWQLWGFVSPGLYPQERKFALPFVVLGSSAFVAGALFCYFALLPKMFEFLLSEGDAVAIGEQVDSARALETEALRYLRLQDVDQAGVVATKATQGLLAGASTTSDDNAPAGSGGELTLRLDALGRMLDAVSTWERPERPVLKAVMEKRLAAIEQRIAVGPASGELDQGAALLAGVAPASADGFASLWRLERTLARSSARHTAENWTRPMLTMHEQLSLVLILELALGIIFELPLVMALLAVVGLVKARWLIKYQRHAIVACLILAAIITPTGDAVNLALMAGPMLLCYEIGVLAVWLIERRRARTTALVPSP